MFVKVIANIECLSIKLQATYLCLHFGCILINFSTFSSSVSSLVLKASGKEKLHWVLSTGIDILILYPVERRYSKTKLFYIQYQLFVILFHIYILFNINYHHAYLQAILFPITKLTYLKF